MILEAMGSREEEGKSATPTAHCDTPLTPPSVDGIQQIKEANMRLEASNDATMGIQNGETNGKITPSEGEAEATRPAVAKVPAESDVATRRVTSQFYVVFHAISAGLNGAALGSDEADIVNLIFIVLDSEQNKIVSRHQYLVKPRQTAGAGRYPAPSNNNLDTPSGHAHGHASSENNNGLLTEQCRLDYPELDEGLIMSAAELDTVLDQFDKVRPAGTFSLVTDGQLPLRQALFTEASRKGLQLRDYYHAFHDLRKEFSAKHPDCQVACLEDMLKYLSIESEENAKDLSMKEANEMAAIVQKLICDDSRLHEPERIVLKLEPGIRSRSDAVDQDCCVRARGLPWQASDQDIAKFFVGLNLARGGVALCLSAQGRRNGEALVLFENATHREMALKRHKHHIGNRYIEVYKATGEDFINIAGGNNKEAQAFLARGGQVIIRMRGLPYDCTAQQVIEFFKANASNANGEEESAAGEKENSIACEVLDEEEGVLFVRKPDGRATGDAFVLFNEEEDADKALRKHKQNIGSRYIELFRSTSAEVQQVINRTMEQHSNNHRQGGGGHHGHGGGNHAAVAAAAAVAALAGGMNAASGQIPLIPHLPTLTHPPHQMQHPQHQLSQAHQAAAAVLPQQMIMTGTRKDCIRLRGLPYEAKEEHILEFLGDHARSIVNHGVHLVYSIQGTPTGEAFIQLNNEQAAYQAAQQRHHRNMTFGKKQRYIEVFQCSGEDMNNVLTGVTPSTGTATGMGTNSPTSVSSAGSNLTPTSSAPGMLASGMPMSPNQNLYLSPAAAGPPTNGQTSPVSQAQQRGVSSPITSMGVAGYPPPHSSSPFFSNPSQGLAHQRALGGYALPPHPLIYWPYPSPPISPNGYYNYPGLIPFGPPPPLPHNGAISPHSMGTPNGSLNGSSPIPSMLTVDVSQHQIQRGLEDIRQRQMTSLTQHPPPNMANLTLTPPSGAGGQTAPGKGDVAETNQ